MNKNKKIAIFNAESLKKVLTDILKDRSKFNRNLQKLNKFVKENTEEIKIKDGKIIEHRK